MRDATRRPGVSDLLARSAPSTDVLAWRAGRPLTRGVFCARVAAWRDLLARQTGRTWAVYVEDTFDFACALFGAWHAGKAVVLPGDLQAATVASLRTVVDGFIGDVAGAIAAPMVDPLQALPSSSPASHREEDAPGWGVLDAEATELTVYTSGTQGQPLGIPKRLAQFEAEVAALERAFGPVCDGLAGSSPTIWSTVTHQHIYGLLFRVLWPLAAGRPLSATRLEFNEQVAGEVRGPAVLVMSPAHLRRLPPAVDWSGVRAGVRAIFSSGGPLPAEAAQSTRALLGVAPIEVYGSSETGGIAWRQVGAGVEPVASSRAAGDAGGRVAFDAIAPYWRPLPGVEIRVADDELEVRSAHLPDRRWWKSADRAITREAGGFDLLGRADRIVKIEEKRVSLEAIERSLAAQAEIAEVRVLLLNVAVEQGAADRDGMTNGAIPVRHSPDAGDAAMSTARSADGQASVPPPAAPHRLAAVAVLSAAGRARLEREGKAAVVAALRSTLLTIVDRVGLPRRWRFVDALPANAQGKCTKASLAELFDPATAAAPRPVRPPAQWTEIEPERAVARLTLTPDLGVFDGHFPAQPILPGVVQLDWAIRFARERFVLPPSFLRVEVLKFSLAAEPGMSLELELRWLAARSALEFAYRSAAGRHSSGRVVFGAGVCPVPALVEGAA